VSAISVPLCNSPTTEESSASNAHGTTALARYDAAKRAIAAAHRIDEIAQIRNGARQLEAAARVAKDTEMIQMATEIRIRAERRLGELLTSTPRAKGVVGRDKKGQTRGSRGVPRVVEPPSLAELGIDKKLSARAQKLAKIPERQFEESIAAAKQIEAEVSAQVILSADDREKRARSRESRRADGTEPVVILGPGPRNSYQVAAAIYRALDELANCELTAKEVWLALPSYQHYRIIKSGPRCHRTSSPSLTRGRIFRAEPIFVGAWLAAAAGFRATP